MSIFRTLLIIMVLRTLFFFWVFSVIAVEVFKVDPKESLETYKANLLDLEQKHLVWLFSLPAELRYNFNPIAGSSLGYKHTEDARAKISELPANKGENN